jgi:hypothetical protein
MARTSSKDKPPVQGNGELDHAQVWPIEAIRPAPENDEIYGSISVDDVWGLAVDIRAHGVLEPILISSDGFIISGHRRRLAAHLAGLSEVQVKVHPVSRQKNPKEFLRLLVAANSQRIKGAGVLLAEAAVKVDPIAAHKQIKADRIAKEKRRREDSTLSEIVSFDDGRRCEFSAAKQPMIDAIQKIFEEQREHWPLTVRQIHYRLLGENAPLIHASKPGSRYANDHDSYRAAIDVCSRGRLAGLIPWEAIDDETRTVDENDAFLNLGEFLDYGTRNFLRGYWRDLLQSQPHHFEIVTEKRTLYQILNQAAKDHTMPFTVMGGMNTITLKKKIVDRYRESGKDKLIVLVISDLDPAGDNIAKDLLKTFRRDFGVYDIEVWKVALTIDQVREFNLIPSGKAKQDSEKARAAAKEYIRKYGTDNIWALEALMPADLVGILKRSIAQVIGVDLFSRELNAEQADAAELVAIRECCAAFFRSLPRLG